MQYVSHRLEDVYDPQFTNGQQLDKVLETVAGSSDYGWFLFHFLWAYLGSDFSSKRIQGTTATALSGTCPNG